VGHRLEAIAVNAGAILERHHAERVVHDTQIQRAFIVTLAGTWITALILVWYVMPIFVPETTPIMAIAPARTGRTAPGRVHDVYLSLRENGHCYWYGDPIAAPEIERRLKALSLKPEQWSEREVQVRVETNTPFVEVRRLIRIAQSGGVPRLVFMVRVADGSQRPCSLTTPARNNAHP
jgi:biopolymer transport protein ExbD